MILFAWKYDCLVIGAAAAYAFQKRPTLLNVFKNNVVALTFFVVAFGCWFSKLSSIHYSDEVHATLFALLILSVTNNADLGKMMNIPILNFLGRISYGLYMYHWVVQSIVMKHIDALGRNNLVIYSLTLIGTVTVATISYYSFELFFLKRKDWSWARWKNTRSLARWREATNAGAENKPMGVGV